jgi:hypothetical protein
MEQNPSVYTAVMWYGMLGAPPVCEVQLPTSRDGGYLLLVPN